jgi:hypothetical protein
MREHGGWRARKEKREREERAIMMYLIQGLPDNVLGVSASGVVTGEDYEKVLIPAAETKLRNHNRISVLYHLGTRFERFEPQALLDDAEFGLKHRREFDRIAVVTDNERLRRVVRTAGSMAPCPIRVFGSANICGAEHWVTAGNNEAHAA